jgi:hypothetical protein
MRVNSGARDPMRRLETLNDPEVTERGRKRLLSVAHDPEYIIYCKAPTDPNNSLAALRHDHDVVPVHEAGHAVAFVLAGEQVRDVRCWLHTSDGTCAGEARHMKHGRHTVDEYLRDFGRDQSIREVVSILAGSAAELRYNPERLAEGKLWDLDSLYDHLLALWFHGDDANELLHTWAWNEACRMFADDRVWAATLELADRLSASITTRSACLAARCI